MADSEVAITNMALTMLGADRITSMTESNERANVCNTVFDMTRDEALQEHPWIFATEIQTLALLSSTNLTAWTYKYQIPASPKYLGTQDLMDTSGTIWENVSYEIIGDVLYTELEDARIRYTKQETNPQNFSAKFDTYLATLLASKVAFRITKNLKLADRMLGLAELQKNGAIGSDVESSPNEEAPPGLWNDARGSSG